MSTIRQPTDAPGGAWASLSRIAWLLFKAWTTPQRICGCKPRRER